MFCSRVSTLIPRLAVVAITLFLLLPAAPAAAQYCPSWSAELIDTSDNCVNDPRRERASDTRTIRWKGHDYLIINLGNELNIYNIDNPASPNLVDESGFNFGTVGDSDYDLIDFDVCDDCRFGLLAHKVARTVVFDFGTGTIPSFGTHATYDTSDLGFGGFTFSKGSQQYLVAAEISASCGNDSALFALDGVSSLNELACVVDGSGSPLLVKTGETVSGNYLYSGERSGIAHVHELVGDGAALTLDHKTSPAGLEIRGHTFSVDSENMLAASVSINNDTVTFWDLTNPAFPVQKPSWTINHDFTEVSLRSPSPGSPSMLWATRTGLNYSTRTYLVKATGPEIFDTLYWTDTALAHNNLSVCTFPAGGALAPDGTTLYLSRYAVHQVFDLTACLGPTPAVAEVSVNPIPVFPGDLVTANDLSVGSVDRWRVWFTEGSDPGGTRVAGPPPPPSATNPHEETFTVPQNVLLTEDFWAHVEVESDELTPSDPQDSAAVIIDRTPVASITMNPAAAITGDTVTLTAVAEGTPSAGSPYEWTITQPDLSTFSRSGVSTDVTLATSGDWTFDLRVNYAHGAPSSSDDPDQDGLYEAEASESISVTSVAADFTISPLSPLNTVAITLDGAASNWAFGVPLSWAWQVTGATSYTGCPDDQVCVIPGGTLNPGAHTITLTLTNTLNSDQSIKVRTLNVGDGTIQPDFAWQPTIPEIGETAVFTVEGVPVEITKATWNFGGIGCDGASATQVCTPLFTDCKALGHQYASSGTKTVNLTVEIDGVPFAANSQQITVASTGSCDGGGGGGGGGGGCTYSISPASKHYPVSGGSGLIAVTTQTGCVWTAVSTAPWVTITNGAGHTSSGPVNYTVAANTGPLRTGILAIAGNSFTVTQSAPFVAANFDMSTSRPEIGETVTFSVDPILEVESWNFGEPDCMGSNPQVNCALLPAGFCNTFNWTFKTSGEKSVTMVLTDDRTQTKHPTVKTTGECCLADGRPNADFQMSSDQAFTGETVVFTDTSTKAGTLKTQAVDFTWSPTSAEIGQSILFNITGVSGDVEADWDFGAAGCGDFEQIFNCSPQFTSCHEATYQFSSSGAIEVSLTVRQGGSTLGTAVHTVNVLSSGSCDGGGGGGCSFILSPTFLQYTANAGSGSFNINTTAECAWNATTSNGWLNITSGSGTGPGSVSYNVAENTGNTRTGGILVEGKTHTVRQDPPAGDTAPTAWQWTVSLGGEVIVTSTEEIFSHKFKEPGFYLVQFEAINCVGSGFFSRFLEIQVSPVEDFVVPSAVKNEGANNTAWQSDFRFFNPCGEDLDVRIEYQPEGVNNTGASPRASTTPASS